MINRILSFDPGDCPTELSDHTRTPHKWGGGACSLRITPSKRLPHVSDYDLRKSNRPSGTRSLSKLAGYVSAHPLI